jgi:hypothetical protein
MQRILKGTTLDASMDEHYELWCHPHNLGRHDVLRIIMFLPS